MTEDQSGPRRFSRKWWLAGAAALLVLAGSGLVSLVVERYGTRALDSAEQAIAPGPGALVVATKWPHGECGGEVAAALPGSPKPESFAGKVDFALQGYPMLGNSTLTLDLSGRGEDVVQVTDLRPVIFKRLEVKPEWAMARPSGCGDTYERLFSVDLDRETIQDRGLVGFPDGPDKPRGDRLGPTFHVSDKDPAHLIIIARTCRGYVEWGLDIEYLDDGERKVHRVASPDSPLRNVGGQAIPAYRWDGGRLRRSTDGSGAESASCVEQAT
ncbi:MAG TPA: hypothetical protein VF062_05630 [Candidatus Limnocylindrales bacterium]